MRALHIARRETIADRQQNIVTELIDRYEIDDIRSINGDA
jgi:hypothetical protein